MPAKRRPPFEMEPGEGKAHEAGETPEEELREGSEEQEGENYPAKRGRKRSARGARRTTAPMDAEGGCCNEKKGKAKCSACAAGKPCGGTMDADCGAKRRGDALTPWEYLDACDLGIQDRSRAYIRARLDAEQRLDAGVKCGGGYIAQGKKCKAGAGHKSSKAKRKPSSTGSLHGAITGYQRNQHNANKAALGGAFLGGGGPVGAAAARNIWADGFEPREDAGVKCGGGYIAQGKKCRNGAGGAAPGGGGATPKKGGGLKTLAKVAGAAALIGGAAYMAHTAGKANQRSLAAARVSTPERRFMMAHAQKAVAARGNRELATRLQKVKQSLAPAFAANAANGRKALEKAVMQRRAAAWKAAASKGRRDSVWAAGFTPDSDLLAI